MSKKTVTVVTGGASGIGAACVKHHVQRGDEVIVLDLPGTWSDAKTKEINPSYGESTYWSFRRSTNT